ncbi:ABC transporter ATP-binding protein [Arenibaculum pallidiluteum]|uniref:ABC transporter ATP-binding protein n=1 Tax=Arenibaculum pallidiluteum TaxID=2812559 RepID=UPI001A96D081|nr:ABC transporter ATP-binding protein [Arenibaculum pallidiluteum]
MATIELRDIAHSYRPDPRGPSDYALRRLSRSWEDGTACALLGPSGCGKTTLLNIISGLITPSEGRILFGGRDVTGLSPERRNIAQVFQFPVIYDTMTVYDNLAFPLRNRGMARPDLDRRVRRVAELLDLTGDLKRRAQRLTPDAKQKISLGRGLVREDVAAILFDEPLTVIDPHMKWQLRRKLREIHKEVRLSLIYVTHDQVEALTFADQVAVMVDGAIVQVGTPQELFEEPAHTFVGYFIGSPGMNLLPCELAEGGARVDGIPIPLPAGPRPDAGPHAGPGARYEIGIRPEFLEIDHLGRAAGNGGAAPGLVPVDVTDVAFLGTHRIVTARLGRHTVKVKLDEGRPVPGDPGLRFPPGRTKLYRDGVLVN